ncbi:MAG: 30S ribosomal protein S18 [Chloroflexi bacterium]|nr:30S ribosomal protein S18 [Chloroflexota bacterium]
MEDIVAEENIPTPENTSETPKETTTEAAAPTPETSEATTPVAETAAPVAETAAPAAPAAPAKPAAAPAASAPRPQHSPQRRPPAPRSRARTRRRRVCSFCVDRIDYIDYKKPDHLLPYISGNGKITSRRRTGTCAKHQRRLAIAIKRARFLALLPYTADHIRLYGNN